MSESIDQVVGIQPIVWAWHLKSDSDRANVVKGRLHLICVLEESVDVGEDGKEECEEYCRFVSMKRQLKIRPENQ